MRYEYRTKGTCSESVSFDLNGDVVTNVNVVNGCDGNLKGICSLIDGLTVDQIVDKLYGIRCQTKATSCPDQIAKAVLSAYRDEQGNR